MWLSPGLFLCRVVTIVLTVLCSKQRLATNGFSQEDEGEPDLDVMAQKPKIHILGYFYPSKLIYF